MRPLALIVVQSCEEPVEITETMAINQSATITINETNGTAVNFNDVIEGDLNQVISNFISINDITIDSLSYSFSNLIGDNKKHLKNKRTCGEAQGGLPLLRGRGLNI